MEFSEVIKEEIKWTKTENRADCKNTTESALLDFFSMIGAMKERPEIDIIKKFVLAYQEDPLSAFRCVFYTRDIREGLGERRAFRVLLTYMGNTYPEIVRKNLKFIPEYGRYDDFYALVGTKAENAMWALVKEQLAEDEDNRKAGKPCFLLAKWLKKQMLPAKIPDSLAFILQNSLACRSTTIKACATVSESILM